MLKLQIKWQSYWLSVKLLITIEINIIKIRFWKLIKTHYHNSLDGNKYSCEANLLPVYVFHKWLLCGKKYSYAIIMWDVV